MTVKDIFAFVGIALIGGGCWIQFAPQISMIVVGAIMLSFVLLTLPKGRRHVDQ